MARESVVEAPRLDPIASPRQSRGRFIESRNLDLLRAIAVLCVFTSHCLIANTGESQFLICLGRFGVLVFFVHTSLVLMMSIERLGQTPRWPIRFYLQRAFRIYPLSILCVLLVLAFRVPRIPQAGFVWPRTGEIAANLLLIQNLNGGHSVSSPLWTLPYEVQMYALLPIAFIWVRRRLFWLVLTLAFLAPAAELLLFSDKPGYVTQFFPCFSGGILAYARWNREGNGRAPSWGWPALILAVALLFCFTGSADKILRLMLSGWAVCLWLGWSVPKFAEARPGWLTRCSHLVAKYSYGIYLSHQLLIWLCFFKWQGASPLQRWAAFSILACITPALAFHTIEYPMIRIGKRIAGASAR